tara:strand:+ start:98 stop:1240 length:1143 start_codon:yes stop_codon:yes gene_type:complete
MFKKTVIILLITIILLLIIEFLSWILVNSTSKNKSSFLYYKKIDKQDCANFTFDMILSNIHNEAIPCNVDQGEMRRGFVYYNHSGTENTSLKILTLGGSTTDGFFANPDEKIFGRKYRTWPFWLSEYCGNVKSCNVINGGIGGYSTSHILRKFFRDIIILEEKPNLIILYTGINDYPGHSGPLELIYPYYDKYQIDALLRGKYVSRHELNIFPSTLRVINYISRKVFDQRIDKNKYFQEELIKKNELLNKSLPRANFKNKTELFAHNVDLLQKFSKAIEIDFVMFLEPTMGLDHEILANYSSNDLNLRKIFDNDYYSMMNKHYNNLRVFCSKRDFCHDISKIIIHDKTDKFIDPRHPNGKTHKLISNKIIDILIKEKKID